MKATVTVFVSETHLEFIEPVEARYEFVHYNAWDYDRALHTAKKMINALSMEIKSEYFEKNEFHDPITCFFIERV